MAPILLGVAPFGMIYGALAIAAGMPAGIAFAMSSIVFAGSAQFIATQLVAAGTPAPVIIFTAVVVNLRHMLYGASVAPYVKQLSNVWKWLLAYLLTDEAYAVAIIHYNTAPEAQFGHWYFLGAGASLWGTWQLATAAGIALGSQVPASWSLDFTLPLTFIALLIPVMKDRAAAAAAVVAGLVAVAGAGLPYKLGLVSAAVAGILVGLLIEARRHAADAGEQVSPVEEA